MEILNKANADTQRTTAHKIVVDVPIVIGDVIDVDVGGAVAVVLVEVDVVMDVALDEVVDDVDDDVVDDVVVVGNVVVDDVVEVVEVDEVVDDVVVGNVVVDDVVDVVVVDVVVDDVVVELVGGAVVDNVVEVVVDDVLVDEVAVEVGGAVVVVEVDGAVVDNVVVGNVVDDVLVDVVVVEVGGAIVDVGGNVVVSTVVGLSTVDDVDPLVVEGNDRVCAATTRVVVAATVVDGNDDTVGGIVVGDGAGGVLVDGRVIDVPNTEGSCDCCLDESSAAISNPATPVAVKNTIAAAIFSPRGAASIARPARQMTEPLPRSREYAGTLCGTPSGPSIHPAGSSSGGRQRPSNDRHQPEFASVILASVSRLD